MINRTDDAFQWQQVLTLRVRQRDKVSDNIILVLYINIMNNYEKQHRASGSLRSADDMSSLTCSMCTTSLLGPCQIVRSSAWHILSCRLRAGGI